MKPSPALALWVVCVLAAVSLPATAADPIFPLGSQIGMVPPPGLAASTSFPGFEDPDNSVFIRLIALPGNAYGEIEKTMTNDALRKQGMTVDKRENLTLPNGKSLLIAARQQADAVRLHKWLFVAPFGEITALVSFEVPSKAVARYPEATIRTAMATVAVRADVPDSEKISLLPFKLGDLAGMRVVRVVPGVALQLTDGPQDTLDAYAQAHLVISAAPGGPQQTRDRDQFARVALTGLPPLKDVRMVSAESMRIGGQPGHEIRAEGRSPQNDAEIEIVQWLRFGTGAYLRILGFGPKQSWTDHFTRFRAVRDGLEPR
jgi:hypothetical protein